MSYQCGVGEGMQSLGFSPRDPHITCDGCGLVWNFPANRPAPQWFFDGKGPKGWRTSIEQDKRRDYCPRCKEEKK